MQCPLHSINRPHLIFMISDSPYSPELPGQLAPQELSPSLRVQGTQKQRFAQPAGPQEAAVDGPGLVGGGHHRHLDTLRYVK